jgi:tetratricopeptide (TPR) repeat protein
VVPGEILTIQPSKAWRFGGFPYLSGTIQSSRLEVEALGLEPLKLQEWEQWDPEEHYWGEEDERLEAWQEELIAQGPRPVFEMAQVIPGEDPDDFDWDPILESVDRKEAGDYRGAEDVLMDLLEADLRCLDAHAHLGNLWFTHIPERAIRHYRVGVLIGELSLGEGFDGVLSWGIINNRPFLRCLHGYGLCLWRTGQFEETVNVFSRMLRLNPSDNQGIRLLIDSVRAGEPWREERSLDMHTLAGTPTFDWPADAGEHILAVLRDRGAPESERLLATELAGDPVVLDDFLVEELLRILAGATESETLRCRAAIALGLALEESELDGLEEPDAPPVTERLLLRAKASLRDLYHDPEIPKEVRRCALEASVRAPEPWHPGAVRAAYHDGDQDWKLSAVFCMRFIPGFDEEIVEALDIDDVDVLYQAVCAAAAHGVDGAWSQVQQLIQAAASGAPILPDDPDAEWSLLLAAMDALVSIRPLEAAETLSGLIESDDEELSEAALEALDLVYGYWDMDEGDDDTTWH